MEPRKVWMASTWRYFRKLAIKIFLILVGLVVGGGWLFLDYSNFEMLIMDLPQDALILGLVALMQAFCITLSPRRFAAIVSEAFRHHYPQQD